MSLIDALITKLCPKGVEFKPLGEVGTIFGGLTGKSKVDFTNGNARFVSYVNVYNNIAVNIEANDFVMIAEGERQRTLQRGDILFTGSSETSDEVGMSSVVTSDVSNPLYLNSFCIGYRLNDPKILDPEFSKYLLRSEEVRKQLIRTANGVTRFNVSKARLAKVRISVPPLQIQREIAKVLDTFTSLEAELEAKLEAELEARRKQYKHYRDSLLTFEDASSKRESERVRWAALKEVGEFTRGRRFTNKDFAESGIPCIHYGEVYTHYGLSATETKSFVRPELAPSLRMAKPGDLIIAGTGENVEDIGKAVAWLGKGEVAVHDDCYIFRHSLNPKYAAHFFQSSQFNEQKVKHAAGAKMIRIPSKGLQKIRIPVPTLEAQARIVTILDKFDALTNDISNDLHAESAARRKQYEHYRDHLLTFQEAA